MKTSHLLILLILFWCMAMYVHNPSDMHECFVGSVTKEKTKLTRSAMDMLASGRSENEDALMSRYQRLYRIGKCRPFLAPKLKGLTNREILGRKLCYCPPSDGNSVGNGWILAKNMPNGACSKNDNTRS